MSGSLPRRGTSDRATSKGEGAIRASASRRAPRSVTSPTLQEVPNEGDVLLA